VLDLLPGYRRTELTQTLGLTATEQERWEHISRRIYVPFHDNGIISQFEGYDKLKELDWEDYYARYGNIRRLDRILDAEGDSPNRYQISKQADVLMLFYLLSADELSGEIVKSCGRRSLIDHAASFIAASSGRSTSTPFSNLAPARTRATRCGALT